MLVADDLIGGDVIDPRDYAEAIARAMPLTITVVAVREETPGQTDVATLYEVRIGGKLVRRSPKDETISFLDGIIAGVNVSRGR